jgi:hypothetical protein
MNISPGLASLLNQVDPPFRVFCHMVPLRVVRVTTDENFCTFRVEQLVRTNKSNIDPKGSWRTISTHGSPKPAYMLREAMNAAVKAQHDLRAKIIRRYPKVIAP